MDNKFANMVRISLFDNWYWSYKRNRLFVYLDTLALGFLGSPPLYQYVLWTKYYVKKFISYLGFGIVEGFVYFYVIF